MGLEQQLKERLEYAAMKARHQDVLRPWYKKWWGIIILILSTLILGLLIFSSIYIINKTRQIMAGEDIGTSQEELQNYKNHIDGDGSNYFIGSRTPQATIIEFGDFACPYSKESAPVIKKLAEEYSDKVKVVWRDYLRNSDSIDLAMTARCAGEQGKFWEMHDELFNHQDSLTTNDADRADKLVDLAEYINLDIDKFKICLSNQTYLEQIKKDYEDGNTLEIVGTPSWFVNYYEFHGTVSEQKFRELINGIIK